MACRRCSLTRRSFRCLETAIEKAAIQRRRLAEGEFYPKNGFYRKLLAFQAPAARQDILAGNRAPVSNQQMSPNTSEPSAMAGQRIAKAVNHVEKRIILRDGIGEIRQLRDRVKRTRQKRQRRDDEIGNGRQMVKLFGPNAANQADLAQKG